MSKERRAGSIDGLLERLQNQSLFSIKELVSPINVVQESRRLTKLRHVNYAGFFRETTNCFTGFSNTDDPHLIDPNKLTSIILTLQSPFDPSKWKPSDEIMNYSTTLLQETLLGKNADFRRGKKESNFIMPTYLILRSLRERSSMWLTGTFLRLTKKQQEKLINETDELKGKILSSINLSWVKEKVEKLFNQTLDFNVLKSEQEVTQEKKEKPLSKTVPVSVYIKEFDRFADENIQPKEELSPEEPHFFDAVTNFIEVDFSQGKLNVPDQEIQKKIKTDPEYKDFYGIFSTNYDQLAAASTISVLSSENGRANTSWTKNSDRKKGFYQRVRNVTNAFSEAFEEICTNDNVFNNLLEAHQRVVSDERAEDVTDLTYSLLNQRLTAILYSHYPISTKEGGPDIVNLSDFLKLPGVSESVLALKKALLIKMAKDGLTNSPEESNLYPGNSDITTFMIDHQNFLHQDEKKFSLKDLRELESNKINLFLAYLNISRYIQDKKIVVKLVEEKKDRFLIDIPDEMLSGFEEPISMNGYPVLLSTNTTQGERMACLYLTWKNVDIAKLYAN